MIACRRILSCCSVVLLFLVSCRAPEGLRRLHVVEREFSAPAEVVFEAAREALEEEGYVVRRAHEAPLEIEALTPIRPNGAFGGAAQGRARVSIHPVELEGTRVRLVLTVLEESEVPVHGVATHEIPVRASLAYERIFSRMIQRLEER